MRSRGADRPVLPWREAVNSRNGASADEPFHVSPPPTATMIRALWASWPRQVVIFLAVLLTAGHSATDRKAFSTSTSLANEAMTLVKLLEQAHYNHEGVRREDFAAVIPDYMKAFDGQRLFFFDTDRARFVEQYGNRVYYSTAFLGNIDAAYRIFEVYQTRVEDRVAWILAQLEQEIDLGTNEVYQPERSKAEWPSAEAADILWLRRLKFELLGEILNKKTIAEAKTAVTKRYGRMLKNLGELESSDLAEVYLSTIAQLFDPHSTYFSADTYEDFGIQMKLQLVGIGALLSLEDDTCMVKEIIPGGPADLSRELKPNDKIIAVAQTGAEPIEVLGMKLRKIVELIRGQKGTAVRLLVQPADATDASARREVVLTRDVVKLNSARARAALFQVPDAEEKLHPIGVITLPAFYGPADDGDTDAEKTTASRDVAQLIAGLKEVGVEGLVLDLRYNGGGYLTEAIDLAGLFIPQGPVVQVRNFTGELQVDHDTNPEIAYAGPLAVLVNRFSASASEIVAGALQNYGRAVVIGDTSTHGKGTVQQVVEMKQLSRALALSPQKTGAAKFTIQKYYLPSGASTQLKGVVPDVVLPSIEEFIPNIGEGDLPRALVWDQIKTSSFEGQPLDANLRTTLAATSNRRQASLEEFAYLKRNIDWFKARQEQKEISLNLETRTKQRAEDTEFRKAMKLGKERIAKSDYAFKPFYLGPPPAPRIKAPKKNDEDDLDATDEENETYVKADIHLREALRIVNDAIHLGQDRSSWVSGHPPLTAATGG